MEVEKESSDTPFEFPASWDLSPQQDFVLGTLADHQGQYVSSKKLTKGLYGKAERPAPAKLRVLMQRCREIVEYFTFGECVISGRRNSGWLISTSDFECLKKFVAQAD